jgi:hypothetical protein
MKSRNPKYDPVTGESKFENNIPPSEVKRDAKIENDAPSAYNQNLANIFGIQTALNSLRLAVLNK